MRKIKIQNRYISKDSPCFIIAEAGINHNGDIEFAKNLVETASEIKSDCIKFQMFKTEYLCNKNSKYYDAFKKLEFSSDEWKEIALYAKKNNILFTSSVFDFEHVDLLDNIGSLFFKIASGDLTYHQLLEYVAEKNKPIILSTGMANIKEIEEALHVIYAKGNKDVVLLHCISNYPVNYQDLNLLYIKVLKEKFGIPVGFSDHTIGNLSAFAAVSIGATVIEKHFTLDKNLEGFDHKLSLNPEEFSDLINGVRIIEKAKGDGKRKISNLERESIKNARRSIHANKPIKKGVILTKDMLKIVRPFEGIEPKYLSNVIGKIAKKNIDEDEVITWKKI